MAQLGKYNELHVVKCLDFGVYLDGQELGEILLPTSQVPPNTKVGDGLEVFLYRDSEDRLIATSKEPFATIDQFAILRVVTVDKVGAWMDWGLDKHLLVPFREQKQDMEAGKSYLVYVYIDHESQRIVASSKLDKFLDNIPPEYEENQEVDLLISNQSEIGYVAIINHTHSGMIYKNEVFQPLKRGQKLKGYIKKIRPDDKIDLTLQKPGYDKIGAMAENIRKLLIKHKGSLPYGDKSSPEEIYEFFQISKKDFKKAIGLLYKRKEIIIENQKINLTKN
ncbi:MAG: S1-like domain-containing RNA-binding protein [Salinivirgaceae bacterium]|nr:S1-like domain-containing RNA-binding protein [Salinivirgaceae bacterium]